MSTVAAAAADDAAHSHGLMPLHHPGRSIGKGAALLLLALLALVILWPLVHVFTGALQENSEASGVRVYTLSTISTVFADPSTLAGIVNTMLLSVIVTLCALVLGSGMAWIVARTDVP